MVRGTEAVCGGSLAIQQFGGCLTDGTCIRPESADAGDGLDHALARR